MKGPSPSEPLEDELVEASGLPFSAGSASAAAAPAASVSSSQSLGTFRCGIQPAATGERPARAGAKEFHCHLCCCERDSFVQQRHFSGCCGRDYAPEVLPEEMRFEPFQPSTQP